MKIPMETLMEMLEQSGCDKLPFMPIYKLVAILEVYYGV